MEQPWVQVLSKFDNDGDEKLHEISAKNTNGTCSKKQKERTDTSVLSGIDGKTPFKKFELDYEIDWKNTKLCNKYHDDCVYSCKPRRLAWYGLYDSCEVRRVKKDTNIAPQMRAQMRLINQLHLDYINSNQRFEMFPVGSIVRLIDTCEDDNYFYFVDSKGHKDAYSIYRPFDKHYVGERDAKKMIITLLQTVSIMHLFDIVHLQLNNKSVLIPSRTTRRIHSRAQNINIKNYGLGCMISKIANDSYDSYNRNGETCNHAIFDRNSIFVAPELLDGNYSVTPASDMWSLGIIIYRLIYQQYPSSNSLKSLLKGKAGTAYNISDMFDTKVSGLWKDLICQMLKKDPNKRVTAMDALNHAALKISHYYYKPCCLCKRLQPAVFVWKTLNTLTTGTMNDFILCCSLWKIYLSNFDFQYVQQRHESVCGCINAKLTSNNSDINEIDGLFIATMMSTFVEDSYEIQLMLLKKIVKRELDSMDPTCGVIIFLVTALIFAMDKCCLNCDGESFENLQYSEQWTILHKLCLTIIRQEELAIKLCREMMKQKIQRENESKEIEIEKSTKSKTWNISIELDNNLNIKHFNKFIQSTIKLFGNMEFLDYLSFSCPRDGLLVSLNTLLIFATDKELPRSRHYATEMIENILLAAINNESLFCKIIAIVKDKKHLNPLKILEAAAAGKSEVFSELMTLLERQQFGFNNNVLNVMIRSAIKQKSCHWIKRLCDLYPNVEISDDLLKEAVFVNGKTTFVGDEAFVTLISTVEKQGKQLTDDTLRYILDGLVSKKTKKTKNHQSHQSVQIVCKLYPNVDIDGDLLSKAASSPNSKSFEILISALAVQSKKQQLGNKSLYNVLATTISTHSPKHVQMLCQLYPNIKINTHFLQQAAASEDWEIFKILTSTITNRYQDPQNDEIDEVLYPTLQSFVSNQSHEGVQKLCQMYPNVKISGDLLKEAVSFTNLEIFDILLSTLAKASSKQPLTDETLYFILQKMVLAQSYKHVQAICQLYPNIKINDDLLRDAIINQSDIFNQLLITFFQQQKIYDFNSYHETQSVNFTFLYDLFVFAAIKKKVKSQTILIQWLPHAKNYSVQHHSQQHKTVTCSLNKIQTKTMASDGLVACIGCLKLMNLKKDGVKNVEYCQKCNFVLCQDCVDQVKLVTLFVFLLNCFSTFSFVSHRQAAHRTARSANGKIMTSR